MGIEDLQQLDIRGYNGNKAALVLTFQLCGTQFTKLSEHLITQYRKESECDIMVRILLRIVENASQNCNNSKNDKFFSVKTPFQIRGYSQTRIRREQL